MGICLENRRTSRQRVSQADDDHKLAFGGPDGDIPNNYDAMRRHLRVKRSLRRRTTYRACNSQKL